MGFFFFFLGLVSGGDDGGGATEPTGISQADEVKFYLSMERLRANLMRDYSRDVRPTVVNGGALTVYLAMSASNLELVRWRNSGVATYCFIELTLDLTGW